MRPIATRSHIPVGDPGVAVTLRAMERLANAGSRNADVIGLAHDIVRYVPERQPAAVAGSVLNFIRSHTRYTEDPWDLEGGKELVKAPDVSAREIREKGRMAGDCDDQVLLAMTLLRAAGVPARPVVISRDDGPYTHVLMEFFDGQRWITMDPIVRGTGLGWFPPRSARIGRLGPRGLSGGG